MKTLKNYTTVDFFYIGPKTVIFHILKKSQVENSPLIQEKSKKKNVNVTWLHKDFNNQPRKPTKA